jgi:hypothetical protein
MLLAELDFGKVQTKVDAIFKQGRKEGFSDIEIGGWIRSRMNGVYSDRTIRNVLPDTAKHQEKVRSAEKTSANERPPLEIPTAKVEPTNKSLPSLEVRTVEGIENDGDIMTDHRPPQQQESIASANPSTEVKPRELSQSQPEPQIIQQPNKTLREQPKHTEVQGYHTIAPREYRVEELDQYDKLTLIEVVKYLHKELTKIATTGRDIERHLPEENDKLKKEKERLENVIKHYLDIFLKYQVGAGLAAMQDFANQVTQRQEKRAQEQVRIYSEDLDRL